MTDQPNPPATPPTVAEATARLDALKADPARVDKLLAGDVAEAKEFSQLSEIIASDGDAADQAIAGIVPGDIPDAGQKRLAEAASWMRSRGLSNDVIRQAITDYEVTPEEVRAVETWKAQKMRSPEFTKAFLAGEPDAVADATSEIAGSADRTSGAADQFAIIVLLQFWQP